MRYAFIILIMLLFFKCSPANAELPPLIEVEDFFKNPEIAAFSLSPDGMKLAYVKPYEHRMNVYVREIATDIEKRITSATERDIAGFFWKGNNNIVYAKDFGGDENYHVYITDLTGNNTRDLTPFDNVKAGVLDDLEEDPEHMLISMNKNNPEVFDVYRCEISTGNEKRITSATERDIAGFLWKGNDKIVFAQDSGGDENFHVYITDIKGSETRDLTPFEKVRAVIIDDLEDDPEHILIALNKRNPEVFDVYRCKIK